MTTSMKASPRKFQETANAMLRNMAPLLAKARSLSFKKMLLPAVETDRSSQQTELLKWQQEMFHRVLNTMCLVQDGLVHPAELTALREDILRTLIAVHPNGEWADYSRDKLLFLQDLFQSRCILEEEYHAAKLPILARLAEQGAQLDTQDFKFSDAELRPIEESKVESTANQAFQKHPGEIEDAPRPTERGDVGSAKKKTPIKHVMDAVSRLKSPGARRMLDLSHSEDKQCKEVTQQQPRVPHALDFLRPRDCPTRDPPVSPAQQNLMSEDCFESPLFKQSNEGSTRDLLPELSSGTKDSHPDLSNLSTDEFVSPPSFPTSPKPATQANASLTPTKQLSFTSRSELTSAKSPLGLSHSASQRLPFSASPKRKVEKSLSRKLTGFLRGWQREEPERDCNDDDPENDGEQDGRETEVKSLWTRSSSKKTIDDHLGEGTSDKDALLSAIEAYPAEKVMGVFVNGQGPNVKKLKKKVSVRAAPTNFFIDQVLGDNIKSELDRIRQEMAITNPGSQQTFTNDQIDAIATRLPVDKTELMRFFPRAWCDRYGDVVLDVVHKEFKSHVTEMNGLRKATKAKRSSRLKAPENDENRASEESSQTTRRGDTNSPKPSSRVKTHSSKSHATTTRVVYTTEGSDYHGASVLQQEQQQQRTDYYFRPPIHHPPPVEGRVKKGIGYEELDVKLGAEILRMPFRNFNESTRF